ncbi:MAG: HAMP domain-containing sensor histidine kinase [Lachnospiraceae bacterium]|nr:HAMP domain-containing sensor histidine kinase [Lachnospiraceae bacterium]
MVLAFVIILIICIILIIYIVCIELQLNSIKKQLDRRRENEASNPVLLEIRDKGIEEMTVSLNKTLRREAALRVSQEIKEQEFKKLITNISHDIRTPLAVMKGYLQLMRKTEMDGAGREYLEICLNHTSAMEKIIKQFFEYSYWSGMEEKITLKKVNITNLVTEVMTDFIPEFEKNNMVMELESTGTYFGMADKELLMRIMQNLLKNSLRYSEGNVKVSIMSMREKPFLEISVKNPAGRDCNIDTSQVFNRFYVGKEERNHSTGLGLSIVKMLVERMGGEVYAHIEDGIFCIGFTIKRTD